MFKIRARELFAKMKLKHWRCLECRIHKNWNNEICEKLWPKKKQNKNKNRQLLNNFISILSDLLLNNNFRHIALDHKYSYLTQIYEYILGLFWDRDLIKRNSCALTPEVTFFCNPMERALSYIFTLLLRVNLSSAPFNSNEAQLVLSSLLSVIIAVRQTHGYLPVAFIDNRSLHLFI